MNEQETIADIIAEIRGARTEFPFVYLMGEPDTPEVIDFRTKEITEPRKINMRRVTVKELADRLEAAYKREKAAIEADALAVGGIVEAERQRKRGDAAKLREVVGDLLYMAERYVKKTPATESVIFDAKTKKEIRTVNYYDVIAKAQAALAAPPRNCDIGSVDEQTVRYRKFCSSHKYLGSDFSHICKGFGKGRCTFFNSRTKSQCELAWAQMPYEEGGAK